MIVLLSMLIACSHNTSSPTSQNLPVVDSPNEIDNIEGNMEEVKTQPEELVEPPPPPPLQSPDGTVMVDCPEDIPDDMACIPGGKMIRGFEGEHTCGQGENQRYKTEFGPTSEVWIQTFLMDKTEVTYEAYQNCRKEQKCDYAHPSYGDFNRPNQPMMGASWHAAKKFVKRKENDCRLKRNGKRLLVVAKEHKHLSMLISSPVMKRSLKMTKVEVVGFKRKAVIQKKVVCGKLLYKLLVNMAYMIW